MIPLTPITPLVRDLKLLTEHHAQLVRERTQTANRLHADLVRIVGTVQHGVVYTGAKGKISEHGGSDPQDRHVALVIFGAGNERGKAITRPVETTSIAPTILALLGLDPGKLQAVQAQRTPILPEG